MDAEFPRLVTAGGHNPAFTVPPHQQGLAAQAGIPQAFHGYKKGIQIKMCDGSLRIHGSKVRRQPLGPRAFFRLAYPQVHQGIGALVSSRAGGVQDRPGYSGLGARWDSKSARFRRFGGPAEVHP